MRPCPKCESPNLLEAAVCADCGHRLPRLAAEVNRDDLDADDRKTALARDALARAHASLEKAEREQRDATGHSVNVRLFFDIALLLIYGGELIYMFASPEDGAIILLLTSASVLLVLTTLLSFEFVQDLFGDALGAFLLFRAAFLLGVIPVMLVCAHIQAVASLREYWDYYAGWWASALLLGLSIHALAG